MQTIRTNCFETNSSSTHSITIQSKSNVMKDDMDVVIAGVLHPQNLRHSSAYRGVAYGDGHTLQARTRDQKAALLVCHIASIDPYYFNPKSGAVTLMKLACDLLVKYCGYVDVITKVDRNPFNAYSEDTTYIDEIMGDREGVDVEGDIADITARVEKHILDVVLNNDMIVFDEETPY